jgi:hypothetical protein
LTVAIPSITDGNVVEWEVGVTYTNGVSGDDQYYVSEFTTNVMSDDDSFGFGLSAESAWNTQSQLFALCPIENWDAIFASQVESVFNPTVQPVPDTSYVIPAED